MTEKFTPGEWDWFISDNGDGFPIIYSGDTNIAEVYLPNGNSEQMLSNASLIATTPKMYAKLKEIQNLFYTFSFRLLRCNEKKNAEQWMKKSMEIQKLLAEARGENEN